MNDYQLPTTNSGYTLIEILVSLTIIGLIFSFGFVGFREFSRRQALISVKRKVIADLRLAQEQALSGKKPSGVSCSDPNVLNGYNFSVTSTTSYEIEANCSGGNTSTKNVNLTEDVALSSSHSTITFRIIGKGTNLDSDAQITISQPATGNSLVIAVSQSGKIE